VPAAVSGSRTSAECTAECCALLWPGSFVVLLVWDGLDIVLEWLVLVMACMRVIVFMLALVVCRMFKGAFKGAVLECMSADWRWPVRCLPPATSHRRWDEDIMHVALSGCRPGVSASCAVRACAQ
jgi:hypothetical protein